MRLLSLLKYSPGQVRFHLFRDLLLVFLLAVGILVVANYLLISQVRKELAQNRLSQATTLVREEVRRLLEPAARQLSILRDQGRSGELKLGDSARLTRQLLPALTHLPRLSGLVVADDQGGEYFLMRDGQQWLSREREPGESGRVTWRRWQASGEPLDNWEETLSYDPRRRPWFQSAVAEISSGEVSWSKPYMFYSRKVPGITASAAWRDGKAVWVVALDVELDTILKTIDELSLGKQGKGFLFLSDGGVYVPREGKEGPVVSNEIPFFSASKSQGGTLAIDAVAAWRRQGKPETGAIRFSSGGQRWWGGFLPLYQDEDSAWLGVATPIADFYSVLMRHWQLILFSAIAVLGGAALLAMLLVRKYSGQLKDVPKLSIDEGRYQDDLHSLIHSGESTHLEFKSTMRMNLRSGKFGKEIELAWLKGVAAFMNTEGGILLIGVDDDGAILGVEADEFENADKCQLHFKNLFNQHLGPELFRFVRFEIYDLEEGSVVTIECERAKEPVFLRNKQSESFYIRSGPSNMELTISQALSYLRRRF
jgi:hypothetical protein